MRLYSLLQVDASADEVTLRRAYKRLVDRLEPDKHLNDLIVGEELQRLRRAYQVLADPERRALYNEFGEIALRKGFDPAAARERIERERATEAQRKRAALAWPTAVKVGPPGPPAAPGAASWSLEVGIGPRMARSGGVLRLPVWRPFPCRRCEGTGRTDRRCRACGGTGEAGARRVDLCAKCRGLGVTGQVGACERCGGRGVRRSRDCKACDGGGKLVTRYFCDVCRGRGVTVARVTQVCGACRGTRVMPCRTCEGSGARDRSKKLSLRVPGRVENGATYRYANAGFSLQAPSDLLVKFTVLPRAPRR